MYNIELDWKSFKVFLPEVQTWAKMECGAHFSGTSANSKLELHFTEEPSDLIKDKIQSMWDQKSESAEAAKFAAEAQKIRSEKYAKENIPYADFSTLIAAERKIWMNQPLTEVDRESLVTKYPNV